MTKAANEPQKLFDTIIIGAGSMGMAAGYYLARSGQRVLLLDEFEPPHTEGSHHGDTRMLRTAYGEGAAYVPLVLRARELWLELEQAFAEWIAADGAGLAERLFAPTGVLGVLSSRSPMIAEIDESTRTYGLPSELLSGREAMSRWSGLKVHDDEVLRFDPHGGVLFSEACIRAYKLGCKRLGASFQFGHSIERLEITDDRVSVHSGGTCFEAAHLILSAGAGTPELLAEWLPEWQLPLQPVRKTIAWFETEGTTYAAASGFPAYYSDGPIGMYYGFPDFGDGVKVGRHDGGRPATRKTVDRVFSVDDEAELRQFLQHTLPGANGWRSREAVCLYTMTPDEHFIIDAHPEHRHVLLAAGFSGHGFKFASAVGEALSQSVIGGRTTGDLSLFRGARFATAAD